MCQKILGGIRSFLKAAHISIHYPNRCLAFYPFSWRRTRYPERVKDGFLIHARAWGPFRFLRAERTGGWTRGPFGRWIPCGFQVRKICE